MSLYPSDWKLSYHAGDPFSIHNPIHGGINIRNVLYGSRGTLGCIVRSSSKQPFFLTNAHVLRPGYITAPSTFPQTGDKVLQPPGGTDARIIGTVARTKVARNCCYPGGTREDVIRSNMQNNRIGDYFDAAIGYIETNYSFDIPGVGIPQGETEPKDGMQYRALCGTSGLISGTVTKGRYDTIGSYEQGAVHVEENVFISNTIWKGGDSGSVLVDIDSKKAIGLIYATAVSKNEYGSPITVALACKASVISAAYHVSFKGIPGDFKPDGKPYIEGEVEPPSIIPDKLPLEYWVIGGATATVILLLISEKN